MKICILGGDGYLGWPTAMYFSARGHDVAVIDNMVKRKWEAELGVQPLIIPPPLQERVRRWFKITRRTINVVVGDIASDPSLIQDLFAKTKPDAIIHYAEQPSAPYSMASRANAVYTQYNNIIGTLNVIFAMHAACPEAHLVKLGTMGEYGTPNIDIEEGWIDIKYKGRESRVLYPKQPGSFYHLSKVHDSHNLEFACRVWQLKVTELNQGVVYGTDTDETQKDPELATSFHYDDVFGTVLNRFIVQAVIGTPLTVYGEGGQTRGYLNLRDTMQCVKLAVLNPAGPGEFRVFNQFTEQFSIMELAQRVKAAAAQRGLPVTINHLFNPRTESEKHYYNAVHTGLVELGLKPHLLDDSVLNHMFDVTISAKVKIKESYILPTITWSDGLLSSAAGQAEQILDN